MSVLGSLCRNSAPARRLRTALRLCSVAVVAGGASVDGPPTDMAGAVRAALQHSPTLRAAVSERTVARVHADRDRPAPEPSMKVSLGLAAQTPSLPFPRSSAEPRFLPARVASATVTLDQALYHPGLAPASRRYRALRAAADLDLLRAANDLIHEVRIAYLDCLTAEAMARVAEEGAAVAREHSAVVERMVTAGLAARRDLASSKADVAEADEGLVRSRNGAALARGNLQRLTGVAWPSALSSPGENALEPAPPDLNAAQTLAESRRPEILALRRQQEAALAGRVLAGLQLAPELAVAATATHQTPTAIVPSNWAYIGLELRWKALDGGRARNDATEAAARADQISALLDEAVAGIRAQTEAAWRGIEAARARIELARQRHELAESALAVSRARYEQRAATLLELSAARLAVSQARVAAAQAEHDLLLSLAELAHSTGAPLVTFRDRLP